MKVDIGPYIYRFDSKLYDRWMRRKYPETWLTMSDNEHTWLDKFIKELDFKIQLVYNYTINRILDKLNRRIKVRIDEHDTWSMDTTLAYIVLPMLKQLKEQKHGSPFVSMSDVPKGLRVSKEELERSEKTGDVDAWHHDRWDWVLDEMIFAFESQTFDYQEMFYSGEADIQWVPIDGDNNEVPREEAKLFRMEDGPNNTFKVDTKGLKEYEKRIDRGFRLFGKYYRNLWS